MRGKLPKQAMLLCGLLWMTMDTASWASLINNLRGVELDTSPVETHITLRADGAIPYRVVSQSDSKIVVDLNSLDPSQSIQTDFATADNIDQVLLKPVNSRTLRMIIRGENLGAPVVRMQRRVVATKPKKPMMVFEQESTAHTTAEATPKRSQVTAPDEKGFALPAVATPVANPEPIRTESSEPTSMQTPTPAADSAASPFQMATEEPGLSGEAGATTADAFALPGETPDPAMMDAEQTMTDRKAIVDPNITEETTQLVEERATWQDSLFVVAGKAFDLAKGILGSTDKNLLFRIVAFTGVLILLGLFIRRKISRENIFADELQEPSPGIWDRLFGSTRRGRPAGSRRPVFQGAASAHARTRYAQERPVGLGGLSQYPGGNSGIIAAPPRGNTLQRNHALNQYAQNAIPPMSNPIPRSRDEIDHELKRSIQARQNILNSQNRKALPPAPAMPPVRPSQPPRPAKAPVLNRPMPPAAQGKLPGSPQKPLPRPQAPQANPMRPSQTAGRAALSRPEPGLPANNKEVLDFLRNVAELMEKDGSPNRANNVKKGLTPKNGAS